MDTDEVIQKILEAGVQAPSGSNSQPWKFRVRGNEIFVYALPERDHPILNYRWRGTWIAHGALIENMSVAASALGYSLDIHTFPDLSDLKLTARIVASSGAAPTEKDKALYEAVFRRCTNRKPYKSTPLTVEQKEEIVFAARAAGGDFRFTEVREKIKKLAQAVAVNEIVMFENEKLHRLMFEEIVLTEKELAERKSGLYVKTMELKPPQEKALRLLRKWPVMQFLNKVGKIARKISRDNIKIDSASPFIGAVVTGNSDSDFILAGRIIERIWLLATKFGLSGHLITGIFFFQQGITAGQVKDFSEEHVNLLRKACQDVGDIFGLEQGIIAGLLRIGHGDEPTARSPKKPPEVEWET